MLASIPASILNQKPPRAGITNCESSSRNHALAIVLDIGIIAGAPNYRPNSSGQIVFATVADNNSELSVVIIKEPKEEDAIVRNIRAVVEEEMRSHGCPTWVLDQTNTVKY